MVNSSSSFDSVSEYLSYAAIEKGLSKNTISAYRRDLEKFCVYLDTENINMDSVDSAVMDDFLGWLRGSGGLQERSSESSNSRAIVTIRNLFKFRSSTKLLATKNSQEASESTESGGDTCLNCFGKFW